MKNNPIIQYVNNFFTNTQKSISTPICLLDYSFIPSLIYLFICLFVYLFIAPFVQAQYQEQTITITPPNLVLTVHPGDKREGTLGLISDAPGDNAFTTSVYDFVVTDTNGTPQVVPQGTILNNRFSAASWIAAYPAQFTAHPHEKVQLSYFLQVPSTASPGGHYAAIVYQPGATKSTQGSGAQILPQVATLIYINVLGKIHEGADVIKFDTPWFQEFGPATITTQIKNAGDLHINPQGILTLKNMFGKTVDAASLPSRNIFPGNVSLIYHSKLGHLLMFGRYTAVLTATYGVGNNYPLYSTVSFWVIPWRLLILLLLIIAALTLAFLWWKKHEDQPSQPPQEEIDTQQIEQ